MVLERLKYRRQFIIGESYVDFNDWNKMKCGKFCLSVHPDLSVVQFDDITILGEMFDPYNPKNSNIEILRSFASECESFNDVIKRTYHMGGRWVIVYHKNNDFKVFNDPCGLRTVFYKGNWCASQPTLLADVLKLSKEFNEFAESTYFEKSERMWVGDGTLYEGVKRLTPNHYYDLNSLCKSRFWINIEKNMNLDEIVNEAAIILQGTIESIVFRFDPMLAVTAGWDSRVLLAASKKNKKDIHYFVSTGNKLNYSHMDIKIPSNLSKKLDLNLEIIDNMSPLRDDFIKNIQSNVLLGRNLSKTKIIQYHYDYTPDKVKVNGNGSEIVRSFYGSGHPENVTTEYLLKLIRYPEEGYQLEELSKWVDSAKGHELNLVDLFYWEQRMGNWGAMYPAEQDIAVEEISPFNNRKLLMILLGTDEKYRKSPNYTLYFRLIEFLWKDTLSEPINPVPFRKKIQRNIFSLMPNSLKNKVKTFVK